MARNLTQSGARPGAGDTVVRVHFWSALVAGPFVLVLALSGVALVFAPEIDAATRPPGALPQRSLVPPIRSLHASLHGGATGAAVVGLLGIALIAEGVTGVWLYGRSATRRPALHRLHRALGAASLAFVALIGLTGTTLAFAAIVVSEPSSGVYDLIRRLHAGDFLGWPSRIVYAAAGTASAVLSITGYVLVARRG